MVSERIRRLREGVQERKEAAANRLEQSRFRRELARSRVRESGPVQEAKATRRELGMLAREVGEPVAGLARRAAGGAERVREAAEGLEGSVADVQEIERDTLAAFEDESFELVSGPPERADSQTVEELRQSGVEKGVQAGDTAFENRIKRAVREDRLDALLRSAPDEFGKAGEDFGVDLEVVDDLRRGERPSPEDDQGLDVLFDDAGEIPELLDDNVKAEFNILRGDG